MSSEGQAPVASSHQAVPVWQPGWWVSGVWLVFLVFPIVSVWSNPEITETARWLSIAALVLFGLSTVVGERMYSHNELHPRDHPNGSRLPNWLDPRRSRVWFSLMVVLAIFAAVTGGLGALGSTPFLVTHAIFVFRWPTAIAVFLIVLGSVIGVLVVSEQLGELWFFTLIIGSVGATAGMFRWLIQRAEEFNVLQTKLLMSEERSRVARDVHDVLGHSLTAIVLKTQVTDAILADLDDVDGPIAEARQQLAELHEVSRQALSEIRTTVTGLRTGDLTEEVAAARSILSDAGVELSVHGDVAAVPDDLNGLFGWVVREAVTNVVRHARASRCTITLDSEDSLLSVADDGIGTAAREGNGLTGLRERLAERNLVLKVRAGDGTQLLVVPGEVAA